MRAGRLLSILLLLQANGRLTAAGLARRLEVSERTVHRDMEALAEAGVPVYAQRGTGGGWLLAEEYRTRLPGLSEAEIQALFLSTPAELLADLGLREAADAALLKLLAALPATYRREAEAAGRRIHVDLAGWRRPREIVPCLPLLQEAVWRGQRLRLSYRRGDGEQRERVVDPLGLVAKGNSWYLVAAVDGDPRTYRVARVAAAELLQEPCVRPPGFDLAAYWERSSAEFSARLPRYPITVRVPPDVLQSGTPGAYARVERAEPPDADGWSTLQLAFEVEEDALAYVLRCGGRLQLLDPPDLEEKAAALAREVLMHYAPARPASAVARGGGG
jgi:predicted DNA-binding transcriptional regulator YafY